MKNKFSKLILAVILASLFSYSIASACSPSLLKIVIQCSNRSFEIIPYEDYLKNDTHEDYQKRLEAKTIDDFRAVSQNCKEDLSPVLKTFEKEIILWLRKDKTLLDGDLIFEPYSLKRDGEIQKSKNALFSCEYEETQHAGDWLIVFKTIRPYCYEDWNVPVEGMCPKTIMSLSDLLLYLVTNISFTTLPYFAGWVIASVVTIYIWWVLLKNQPAMKWWKLLLVSLVMLVAVLILITPPSQILGQVIGWVLAYGLMILWYKQRKGTSKQKTG